MVEVGKMRQMRGEGYQMLKAFFGNLISKRATISLKAPYASGEHVNFLFFRMSQLLLLITEFNSDNNMMTVT